MQVGSKSEKGGQRESFKSLHVIAASSLAIGAVEIFEGLHRGEVKMSGIGGVTLVIGMMLEGAVAYLKRH